MADRMSLDFDLAPNRKDEGGDGIHPQLGPRPAKPQLSYGLETSGEIHLLDYVKILYKRRWLALTSFALVFLSTVFYTFSTVPIYQARVQVLIEKENSNVVEFKEAFEQ